MAGKKHRRMCLQVGKLNYSALLVLGVIYFANELGASEKGVIESSEKVFSCLICDAQRIRQWCGWRDRHLCKTNLMWRYPELWYHLPLDFTSPRSHTLHASFKLMRVCCRKDQLLISRRIRPMAAVLLPHVCTPERCHEITSDALFDACMLAVAFGYKSARHLSMH